MDEYITKIFDKLQKLIFEGNYFKTEKVLRKVHN